MERLDDPRLDLAVVDLVDGEVSERLGAPGAETDELGEVAAVVAEALELDELDAVDRLRWRVGLQLEGALGLGTQIHPVTTSGEDSRSRLGLEKAHEVLAVEILLHRGGDAQDVLGRDVAHLEGDLLDAGHHEPLPLLDRLDERRGLKQRLVGPGVEPRDSAAEALDVEGAGRQVRQVDVGDLELTARRGPEPGGDAGDLVVDRKSTRLNSSH